MDSFTEKILERARERQRKLLEYGSSSTANFKSLSNPTITDNTVTTLKDPDERKSLSTPAINATQTDNTKSSDDSASTVTPKKIDTTNAYKINRTFITSDSQLNSNKNVSDDLPLKGSISEGNFSKLLKQNSSKLNISSEIPGSPQLQLKTLNIQKENFNMEIKLCSMENVRIEVELQEESDSNDEEAPQEKGEVGGSSSNQPPIREDAKRRLQRLGKLYAGGDDADIPSPIHRTEPTFSAESDSPKSTIIKQKRFEEKENKPLAKSHKGLEGLAALAKNINQWEDDLSKTKPIIMHTENTSENKKIMLKEQINQQVVSSMKSNIENKIAVASKATFSESTTSSTKSAVFNNKDPALLSIAERKALFEKNMGAAPIPKAPISMPMPFHKEKSKSKTDISVSSTLKDHKSSAPKFTSHITTETTISKSLSDQSVLCSTKGNKPESVKSSNSTSNLKSPIKYTSPKPPIKPDMIDSPTHKVTPGRKGGIASKVAALFQNKSTISQQQIENDIREQRQKEMDILLNRFHKNKRMHDIKDIIINRPSDESESENEEASETTAMISHKPPQIVKRPQGIPPPPPLPGNKRKSGGRRYSEEDSIKVAAVLDDVKHIKVKGTKPGQLYPCLSDIEATTETENEHNTASPTPNNSSTEDNSYDSDINEANTSFGRDVLETVCRITPQKRIYDVDTASDISDILDDMDDYLDEAMAYGSPTKSGPTPPKQKRSISPENESQSSSSSFQYKQGSPQKHNSEVQDFRTPTKVVFSRRSSEFPTYVVDGDNVLPLKHTVSFYRKQQMQNSTTPVRQIVRQPAIEESPKSITSLSSNEENEVYNKIQSLREDITRQQTIISQSSQALNLCYATPEFTGSTEQVEAEKLLLLATHRRAAAQREIGRLSVSKSLHTQNSIDSDESFEKGSLTISNIILPLKRDYVRALNATGGKGHHVVCLVKCAEQVHPTQLVSTLATNDKNPNLELNIPGTIRLTDIYSNFKVQFEVYCLQAQEEMLPHEVKYHINNKKSHKSIPKKVKTESRLIMPPLESPGGPQVVRSPTFALMGYVVFSIQGINRKNWTLTNTPSMSPLEGIVEMHIKSALKLSSVEHHGFLTMFENVSGFGAWHRRWCLLKGHILSYWKYPEEENKQTSIGSIDLRSCVTKQIGPVCRDICARLHTILIETARPAEPHDKDSLVLECRGNKTIIRNLLSADTKEERIEWCTMFNKAIAAVN